MDTTNILNSIRNISEVINIKENKDEVIKHSRDWRGRINNNALCVVFPKSNNDVSKLLKFANSNNLKVIPQGGNTSLVAGSSPTENEKEILINLKKMDKNLIDMRELFQKKPMPVMPIKADEIMSKYKISEGEYLGSKLKLIEEKWVNNNFKISDRQVDQIIEN